MRHPLILRALLGGAGIVGCIAVLAGTARATDIPKNNFAVRSPYTSTLPATPNLFGSVALRIRAERFDDEWERARRDASNLPAMQQLVAPARFLTPDRQLGYVQTAVNQRIRWMSDATLRGRHDYWASAAETLAAGAGDMEDRAILKMQALRALGFPSRDLYLTLGRDRADGPETVLIVRLAGRYYVLDDTGAPPYPPEHTTQFTPVVTFGFGATWVHAFPKVPAPTVAAAASTFRGTADHR
jgi:predicted transglutaminase-like cysteine proteinase